MENEVKLYDWKFYGQAEGFDIVSIHEWYQQNFWFLEISSNFWVDFCGLSSNRRHNPLLPEKKTHEQQQPTSSRKCGTSRQTCQWHQ